MVPNLRDLHDLITLVKYVLFISPKKPLYDRFSWKEKLEYIGICWGTPLLGITGFLLWGEELFSSYVPGWVLNVAYLAHTYESFLAIAHIVLVHLPSVFGRPGLSPLSAMIFSGKISPRVLAEEHGNQIIEFENATEIKS